jgi:hypothetical protein
MPETASGPDADVLQTVASIVTARGRCSMAPSSHAAHRAAASTEVIICRLRFETVTYREAGMLPTRADGLVMAHEVRKQTHSSMRFVCVAPSAEQQSAVCLLPDLTTQDGRDQPSHVLA